MTVGAAAGAGTMLNRAAMQTDKRVLVIGGTRGTGLLISRLLTTTGTSVRVLARDPASARTRLEPSIEIAVGDITRPETLDSAFRDVGHVVFTAGCRSGRPVRQSRIKATEFDGILNTLAAAQRVRFAGRFLYMTSSGVRSHSFWTFSLNVYKGNTLVWRARAEDAIRASGLAYTIVRTGMLTNQPAGTHAIELTQRSLPLSPRYRIARADVAAFFVAALDHPRAVRATFEIVWNGPPRPQRFAELMDQLVPDDTMTVLKQP